MKTGVYCFRGPRGFTYYEKTVYMYSFDVVLKNFYNKMFYDII